MLSLESLLREARVPARVRLQAKASLEDGGAERVRRAVEALPERQKLVVALRYYEALRLEEIATVLGAREEQVREVLEKGARALAEKLIRARRTARPTSATQGGASR